MLHIVQMLAFQVQDQEAAIATLERKLAEYQAVGNTNKVKGCRMHLAKEKKHV